MNGLAVATRLLVGAWALAFALGFAVNVVLRVPLTRKALVWCWLAAVALAALGEALHVRATAARTGGSTEGQRVGPGDGTA